CRSKESRHAFNYDLINSPDPTSQLSSVWRIPVVPMGEKTISSSTHFVGRGRVGLPPRSWGASSWGREGARVRWARGAQDRCGGEGRCSPSRNIEI
ncbi:MAG TPA: hypothetical protein VFY59_19235, partial [Rubrobacter sp.]|nr:hypothetical protein [Rubrobacter sp.]